MNPTKRLARIAGGLYLLVGIFAGFAEGFVEPRMYAAGNAAATAGNVVANAGLLRMGIVADLLDGTFFVFTALALYMLLKDVHKSAARAMLVFVVIAATITCISAVFEFESCGRDWCCQRHRTRRGRSHALVLLSLMLSTTDCLPRRSSSASGWRRSATWHTGRVVSKALGVVLVVASVSYLVDVIAASLFPTSTSTFTLSRASCLRSPSPGWSSTSS